jgi:hypothetical protein
MRGLLSLTFAGLLMTVGVLSLAPRAEAGPPRLEYWEGQAEIARERREMRQSIRTAQTPEAKRKAYHQGLREIHAEKQEMRREVTRSVIQRKILIEILN